MASRLAIRHGGAGVRHPHGTRRHRKIAYTSGAWRIDWATLLKRVYDVDALACPCGGRLKFVEVVTEADRARQLLGELGLDLTAPKVARARSPTDDFDPPPPDDW